MKEYRKRIIDDLLELSMEAFGATWIRGPKGCGKTTTAKQKARTVVEFQDEEKRDNLLTIANTAPSKLLIGDKPILFDEWQDAPKLFGAIRKDVDDSGEKGCYILTGSSSKEVKTPHTGTLRISHLKMYPMSLFESGDSNGSVSLIRLFDDPGSFDGCHSDMSIDDIIFSICRGGWPGALDTKTERSKLLVAKEIYKQTYSTDISNIDHVKRKPQITMDLLKSYSRNLCTFATTKTILSDVKANNTVSDPTVYDYINALTELYIIDDIDAWCPSIRSKTVIRSGKKRNFIDPSIAVAALGLSPDYFNKDFKTLGFLFESLCIRDLKVYSSVYDGYMSYYHDRYGLEADGVLHLNDGRYALIEFKLGQTEVDEGAKHLCEIEKLVAMHNENEPQCPLRLPDLKLVVTGTEYGYRRDDGVFVIPIGCLKN
ncbi:MAG: ATP-binding protein [Lachnospiraceae bacterium]|nr:ATP-binding protein [Lachnospiraceae bacterium]